MVALYHLAPQKDENSNKYYAEAYIKRGRYKDGVYYQTPKMRINKIILSAIKSELSLRFILLISEVSDLDIFFVPSLKLIILGEVFSIIGSGSGKKLSQLKSQLEKHMSEEEKTALKREVKAKRKQIKEEYKDLIDFQKDELKKLIEKSGFKITSWNWECGNEVLILTK